MERSMNDETQNQEPKVQQIELSHFATITLNGDGTGSIDGSLIDERPEGWEEDPVHVAIDNLFGLVPPEVNEILGLKEGSTASHRADTRKRKRAAVLEYAATLKLGRVILG